MTREEIIEAIQELVKRTGTVPGRATFTNETGIGRHEWYGRYWPKWGDALLEAGFQPNEKNLPAERTSLLAAYLVLVEELQHIPTEGELRVRRHADKSFPGHEALRAQLGPKREQIKALLEYATSVRASAGVVGILTAAASPQNEPAPPDYAARLQFADGFVYLMKSGRNFKIGRTNAVDRRQYEIGVQLPEKLDPVHSIRTDDPSGIEAYWHNRFKERRLNGEWFRLTADDVRVFKKRRFM